MVWSSLSYKMDSIIIIPTLQKKKLRYKEAK